MIPASIVKKCHSETLGMKNIDILTFKGFFTFFSFLYASYCFIIFTQNNINKKIKLNSVIIYIMFFQICMSILWNTKYLINPWNYNKKGQV